MGGLTFEWLRAANVQRCEDVFHPLHSWSPNDWATAAAGELGELCNLLKKRHRGEQVDDEALANELADVAIYLDLLAARLDIDLGEAVREKFNRVSIDRRCRIRL